ncbi:MAG: insulinase family protein, partial [Treponema sp.]|nr:insulinase family protein [Treponema sp.]
MEEVICGFKVLDRSSVPEMNGEGVWLKHKKTGMEVYHLCCDDEENLFSFAFKTPPADSTGVAHVIEHSVLCGSKHFPLKDPFLQLANQSVKTFLNAMTFPDKTVYPASSMIEADYFNLMAVYGDAVFFPLLEEWTFAQEAHHLEYDENGKLCIKGVVYNEMKGNYSSFDGIAADHSIRSLLQGTSYAVDSGGDPDFIPDLTYEQFKKFHETYYSPANCRLFLYGNIPLEKQLAFIEERFLKPFEADQAKMDEIKKRVSGISVGKLVHFAEPKTLTVTAPAGSEGKGETVLINWMTGSGSDAVESMESAFLSEILLGHDAAPLSRVLVESRLGEDISPCTGLETELAYTCFTVGL